MSLLINDLATVPAATLQVPTLQDQGSQERSPVRLLLVEDNPADALLAQEYIRGVIADVEFDNAVRLADITAESADRASCAILDLSLPDASGLEALHALRAMSERLPIIVLTGFDDLDLGLAAIRHGAEDYLIKNHVDGLTLQRSIRYAIERRHLTLELVSQAAAAAVATATSIVAVAAADAAGGRTAPHTAVGTHQVAVRIDATTGDYVLECQSCTWEAERGLESQLSWADRCLEWALLKHVDFGENPPVAWAGSETAASDQRAGRNDPQPEVTVSRRHLFALDEWFRDS